MRPLFFCYSGWQVLPIFTKLKKSILTATRNSTSIITFIAAVVCTVALFFSHVATPADLSPSQNQVSTEFTLQSETGGFVPLKVLSIHSFSLPATFHFRTNLTPCFLFRIFFKSWTIENYTEEASLDDNLFFEIIFTFFISPNAP